MLCFLTNCIIDVRMTDTNSPSYLNDTPADVIENQEKQKKRKYVNSCLKQRRTFTPFVLSVDGLLGKEAKSFLKAISTHLASKWDQPYSVVRGYVNAKISIAALRASHQCIRGSRTPSTRICRDRWYEKPWDDGAGLNLFKHTITFLLSDYPKNTFPCVHLNITPREECIHNCKLYHLQLFILLPTHITIQASLQRYECIQLYIVLFSMHTAITIDFK